MSGSGRLPTSGYLIDRIYANHLSLQVKRPGPESPPEGNLSFSWDWRLLKDGQFEVTLGMGIDPSPRRPEEIRATLSGRFHPEGESQEVPLESFVRYHAPAILMPYIREAISSLTARGFVGALLLPPLNVQLLVEVHDPSEAEGAKQLAEAAKQPLVPSAGSL